MNVDYFGLMPLPGILTLFYWKMGLIMNKKIISSAVFVSCCLSSTLVLAEVVHKGVNISSEINIGALKVSDRDIAPWAFNAESNLDGVFVLDDDLKIKYQLGANITRAINDNDTDGSTWTVGKPSDITDENVYIRNAKIILLSNYGTFLIAPRTVSGQWLQVYGDLDTFEYNRFHSQSGKISFFNQAEQTEDLFAYSTPKFGGFQFGTSIVATNENNGVNGDVWTNRLTYRNEGLYFAASHTIMQADSLPTNKDYKRSALSFSYDMGMLKFASVYEMDRDHPSGDFDVYGVNLQLKPNQDWTLGAAYVEKDHDTNDGLDKDGIVFGVKRHFGDSVMLFAETGQYTGAPDNVAVGVSLKF